MHRRIRSLAVLLAGVLLLLGLGLPTAGAAAPYCGITWGSLEKTQDAAPGAPLVGVRAGQHSCYDRVVIDLQGAPGYTVGYVPAVLTQGQGAELALRGGAFLQIDVQAPAYDQHGNPTYTAACTADVVPVAGYRTFRQVAWAGSSEGVTTLGVGTRARLPFRVFVLHDPAGARLVVDVAHRW